MAGIKRKLEITIGLLLLLASSLVYSTSSDPDNKVTAFWQQTVETESSVPVDHSVWGLFLDRYWRSGSDGIARLDYGAVDNEGRQLLNSYLESLVQTDIRQYPEAEQQAYWLNFYNALTAQLILDHYPVKSIKKIRLSWRSLVNLGPWEDKLITVQGQKLSLNDIEHRILRAIWGDHRIHFAVNCASLGCPSLPKLPFVAADLDTRLTSAGREYLQHSRGLSFDEDGVLHLSKIFTWFSSDFGDREDDVLLTLSVYVSPSISQRLQTYNGVVKYHYDWSLNDIDSSH